MKKKIIIVIGGAILAALIGYRIFKPADEINTKPLPTVTTAVVSNGNIERKTSLIGTVSAANTYNVTPKAAGEILEVYVQQGDHLNEGDPICKIDNQKSIDAARLALEGAEVGLKNAGESSVMAKTNFERMENLYSVGDISKQAYESAKNAYDQAEAGLESAKIQYETAKLNYDTQVEFSIITAPVTGGIENTAMTVNALVSPASVLCTMNSDEKNEFTFNVTDIIHSSINVGDAIEIERNGSTYGGEITSIANVPGNISGLYPVKAILNDNGAVTVGSTAKVTFVSDKSINVPVIATKNVYYDGGSAFVYTVEESSEEIDAETMIADGNSLGIIHKRKVEIGISDDENTEIISGVKAGESVVDSWTSQLYEGGRVQIRRADGGAK